MDFKTSKKSGSLEDLYKTMCEKEGVTPKTVEELKEEDARAEQVALQKEREKRQKQEQKNQIRRQQQKNTVRVIKKEKDGVTIKAGNHTHKVSWSEFEQNFQKVEGKDFLYTFTEEFLKDAEEINQLVDFAVITYREIVVMEKNGKPDPAKYLSAMARLGGMTTSVTEKLGCSIAEATKLIKDRYDMMFDPNTGLFAGNLL